VAGDVWRAFGNIDNYVEPFFGSGAVLLAQPYSSGRVETVNDINAWLTNFWRALQHDPDGVAVAADYPVSELDLHARGDWLFYRAEAPQFVERLRSDPDYYDVKSAGWWLWGICQWIGADWNRRDCPDAGKGVGELVNAGRGVNRKIPHLVNAGRGVNRKIPHLVNAGRGVNRKSCSARGEAIREYMRQLSERLRDVRICCGDWKRVLGPSQTYGLGATGIFLDPPYAPENRVDVYGPNDDGLVFSRVREWAIENGSNRLLRIALCGYDFEMPTSWTRRRWKPGGGYAVGGDGNGRLNRKKEMVWFSPACVHMQKELMP